MQSLLYVVHRPKISSLLCMRNHIPYLHPLINSVIHHLCNSILLKFFRNFSFMPNHMIKSISQNVHVYSSLWWQSCLSHNSTLSLSLIVLVHNFIIIYKCYKITSFSKRLYIHMISYTHVNKFQCTSPLRWCNSFCKFNYILLCC